MPAQFAYRWALLCREERRASSARVYAAMLAAAVGYALSAFVPIWMTHVVEPAATEAALRRFFLEPQQWGNATFMNSAGNFTLVYISRGVGGCVISY